MTSFALNGMERDRIESLQSRTLIFIHHNSKNDRKKTKKALKTIETVLGVEFISLDNLNNISMRSNLC